MFSHELLWLVMVLLVVLFYIILYLFICSEEAQEYIEIGTLNGLFVLGRTMGFIGKL